MNGDGPASLATPVALSTGATSASPVGTYAIVASGATSTDYQILFGNGTLTITQAGTTTGLVASPTAIGFGQGVTLTATIGVVSPGAGSPSGSVQFFLGATSLGTAGLSGNTAVLTTTTLPIGADSLTAQYLGDSSFTGSTSAAAVVTVGIATSTSVTSSLSPSVHGQSVTFTATVTPSSGTATLTGSVTFYAGSTALGTATIASKKATLATTAVPTGSQAITAVYSGDSHYGPSTSAALTQVVNQAFTTTSVASSANPAVYGQSVTYTATVKAVSPGSGTPTGTVTFYDGRTSLGAGTLSAGTARVTTAFLVVGAHSITAAYNGDANFTTSTSSALGQTINQASTVTTIVSAVNPTVYGQPMTFTVSVAASSPGAGMPTGTVTLTSGSTQLGTATLNNGTATITTTTPLAVGKPSIAASYGGDGHFKASAGTVAQTINQDGTTTSLASSTNPSAYGQSVTFTVTVAANAPGSGTPTGSITFLNGATTLATFTLSNGTASYSTAKLPTGTDTITAKYNGSASSIASTAGVAQAVNQDATSTSVTSSFDPSTYGQSVTFSATVSANPPGSGTPTGTVTFYDGSTPIGTGTLSSGKATFKTSTLPAGSQAITAVYGGDINFTGSTSAALTQVVNQDATTTKLTSSANPSSYGQSVTFTATVGAVYPGQRDADRIGHLHGRDHRHRHRDPGRHGHRDLHDVRLLGREPHDHRRLRRRRQLHDEHVNGPRPEGQPGRHDHGAGVVGQSFDVRPDGRLHGDDRRVVAGERHADRDGHLLQRVGDARHGDSDRGDRDALDLLAVGRK